MIFLLFCDKCHTHLGKFIDSTFIIYSLFFFFFDHEDGPNDFCSKFKLGSLGCFTGTKPPCWSGQDLQLCVG